MNPPTELQFVQLTGRSFEEHLEEGIKPIEQTLWSQHVFAVLQLLCYSRLLFFRDLAARDPGWDKRNNKHGSVQKSDIIPQVVNLFRVFLGHKRALEVFDNNIEGCLLVEAPWNIVLGNYHQVWAEHIFGHHQKIWCNLIQPDQGSMAFVMYTYCIIVHYYAKVNCSIAC